MEVLVVAHDPAWMGKYQAEAARIRQALGPVAVRVHHIGSTAVPGIVAKPIVDMLVEAPSPEAVDKQSDALEAFGYEAKGEFGIPGRRYFRKDDDNGQREYHLHAFGAGSEQVVRHLAFRDYLRTHPDVAWAYSRLKSELAQKNAEDIEAYINGKDPFIKATERAALAWWHARSSAPPS